MNMNIYIYKYVHINMNKNMSVINSAFCFSGGRPAVAFKLKSPRASEFLKSDRDPRSAFSGVREVVFRLCFFH